MDNFNLKEDEDFSAEKINKAVKDNIELFELVVKRFDDNVKALDEIQGTVDWGRGDIEEEEQMIRTIETWAYLCKTQRNRCLLSA